VKTYAVALENIMEKRATPVTPEATVKSPKEPGVSAAAVDKIPFTATTIVTVFAPAVLSTYRSKIVPLAALSAAPSNVPVGRVIAVAAADVEVMYPVATSAAVAVAVALIAEVVACVTLPVPAILPVTLPVRLPTKPLLDVTGPEKVVDAMIEFLLCYSTYAHTVSITSAKPVCMSRGSWVTYVLSLYMRGVKRT